MEVIGLSNLVLLVCAALVVVGTLSSLLAARFGAPLLLIFLLIGVLAGEDGPGGIHFSDYGATYIVGSAALAVILFDGGLRMRATTMRGALGPAFLLSTAGVFITAALVAGAAMVLLGLGFLEGLLVGAIVASTDAAAVLFLVRAQGLRLGRRVGAVIEIESATNDPAAVFLTIMLVELMMAGTTHAGWDILAGAGQELVLGIVFGVAGGFLLTFMINRVDLPAGLHPVFVVASAIVIFAFTSVLHGSGFLAVYLAGLVVGNRPVRALAAITSFHDTVTWLCQIVMFVMLGLLVSPHSLVDSILPGLGVAAFLILLGRPATVFLCLWPFGFSLREKLFVSAGLPGAHTYFNIAFIVVVTSLLLHGWTLALAARRLDVALADPLREPQRFEIDLPGQSEHELVAYPVAAGTVGIRADLLPEWARMVLVVREGKVLGPEEAGLLLARDYVYLLTPPQRVHQLDRLFMLEELVWGQDAAFPFAGEIRLGDIGELYGLPIPLRDQDFTVAAAFADRTDDRPAPGMRIVFGHAAIEVRQVENGRVTLAALRLERDDAGRGTQFIQGFLRLARKGRNQSDTF
ncbi:MAG: K+/H+ antiporter [Rhizobiales bacterium 35-66-30]|nr:MAG: K+/H+ antiporter [Rhizobiales bacterium 35-66-30]